ncbi:MAG: TRAP transporter small permease, partial [Mesorhizobium sp.]
MTSSSEQRPSLFGIARVMSRVSTAALWIAGIGLV